MKQLFLSLTALFITFLSCNKEESNITTDINNYSLKSVSPEPFDWEKIDWMPTPPYQAKIPVPWIGQGSITSTQEYDVVYDHKKKDGWILMYSTFRSTATAPLQNPYFILYNKYRGLMRIYIYTTTQFVQPSTYLQDGINIIGAESSILNYCGSDIVDISVNNRTYSQIQPKPIDGSIPLASNKWHMLQYELAYDPNIKNTLYNQIQFSWFTNYCNIEEINIEGGITGEVKSITGKSAQDNAMAALGEVGEASGIMFLSSLGTNFISKKTTNKFSGENKYKIPREIWKSISKGGKSAITSATKNLPGAITNLFSAVIGGATEQTMTLNVNLYMELQGNTTSYGSLPASPTSLYIPGCKITNNTQGYIPLFKHSVGVFYIKSKPVVNTEKHFNVVRTGSPSEGFSSYMKNTVFMNNQNFKNLIVINPSVLDVANVEIVDQDILYINRGKNGIVLSCDGIKESIGARIAYTNPNKLVYKGNLNFQAVVRFKIKVSPKDGSPSSILIKTFAADQQGSTTYDGVVLD